MTKHRSVDYFPVEAPYLQVAPYYRYYIAAPYLRGVYEVLHVSKHTVRLRGTNWEMWRGWIKAKAWVQNELESKTNQRRVAKRRARRKW